MRKRIALGCAALMAVAMSPLGLTSTQSAEPKPRVVKVRDNFFSPDALSVKKGTKIVWRWPSIPGDVHDVYLARRPAGVRRFHSDLAGSHYSFARRLKKPGRYRMVCTIHEEMTMRVRVRR